MKTPVTRRLFLAGAAAAVLPAADRKPSLILLTETDAARMRDALTAERRAPIETQAAAALKAGPWSVTYFPGLAGMGLPSQKLLSACLQLPRAQSGFVQLVDMLVRQ